MSSSTTTGKRARDEEELEEMWEKLKAVRADPKHADLWEKILHDVEASSEDDDNSFENLVELAKEYGGCCELRMKVAIEGAGYFYNRYTKVPASWETFSSYCDHEEGDCWCGECSEGCKCLDKQ